MMKITVEKDGIELLQREIVRMSTNEGNLTVALAGNSMIDIPLAFGKSYSLTITTPEQTISKTCIYLSYNYVVYSQSNDDAENPSNTFVVAENSLVLREIL
jgi:hypothetical protein